MQINRYHHPPASACDERDLDRIIERLADAVDPGEFRESELEERVDGLLDVARSVFAVAGAGLMLVDEREQLGLSGASSEAARALGRAQQQRGVGPGVQSTKTQQVVVVEDLAVDPRWPQLSESLAGREVRGVLSAPISLYGRSAGNLSLVDTKSRAWTVADLDRARSLAEVVAAWLSVAVDAHNSGRRVSQLERMVGSYRWLIPPRSHHDHAGSGRSDPPRARWSGEPAVAFDEASARPVVAVSQGFLNCSRCGLSISVRFTWLMPEHCPRCLARARVAHPMFRSPLPFSLLTARPAGGQRENDRRWGRADGEPPRAG